MNRMTALSLMAFTIININIVQENNLANLYMNEYKSVREKLNIDKKSISICVTTIVSNYKNGELVNVMRMITRDNVDGSFIRTNAEFIDKPKIIVEQIKGTYMTDCYLYGYTAKYGYFFKLIRESPDKPWILTKYLSNVNSRTEAIEEVDLLASREAMFPSEYKTPDKYRKASLTIKKNDIDTLPENKNLIIEEAKYHDRGKNLIYIKYFCPFYDMLKGMAYPRNGWAIFDRDRYWEPIEHKFTNGDDKFKITRHYKKTLISRCPIPLTKEMTIIETIEDSGTITENKTIIVNDIKFGDQVTDEDFRLLAFGLPEPVGLMVPDKRTPLFVWFLAIAAGIMVVSTVIGILWRRRLRRLAGSG